MGSGKSEDNGLVVGSGDARYGCARLCERTRVDRPKIVLVGQVLLHVSRTVAESCVKRTRDTVSDVFRRDRRAVREFDPVAQRVRPGPAPIDCTAGVRGKITSEYEPDRAV